MFNFSLSEVKPANTTSYLKPYNIYKDVKMSDIDIISGKKSDGNEWKALQVTFSCDERSYKHNIFFITNDNSNFQMREVDGSNGGKRMVPSNWTNVSNELAAIGFAFFPNDFGKLQAASAKAKTFDDIANAFVKMGKANLNKVSTGMKLLGRESNGTVFASFPRFTGIAQAKNEKSAESNGVKIGEWYTWLISPFGDKLNFSAYEMQQKSKYENAKPTPMKEDSPLESLDLPANNDESTEDLDFDKYL